MFVKQISVFVENKKGHLAEITKAMAEAGIDILAISIADTTDFGILRMIVNNSDKAVEIVRDIGYTVNITNVIAVEVPDHPGGLNDVLRILDNANVSIEYLYSFARTKQDSALILFRVENAVQAVEILKAEGLKLLEQAQIDKF